MIPFSKRLQAHAARSPVPTDLCRISLGFRPRRERMTIQFTEVCAHRAAQRLYGGQDDAVFTPEDERRVPHQGDGHRLWLNPITGEDARHRLLAGTSHLLDREASSWGQGQMPYLMLAASPKRWPCALSAGA